MYPRKSETDLGTCPPANWTCQVCGKWNLLKHSNTCQKLQNHLTGNICREDNLCEHRCGNTRKVVNHMWFWRQLEQESCISSDELWGTRRNRVVNLVITNSLHPTSALLDFSYQVDLHNQIDSYNCKQRAI